MNQDVDGNRKLFWKKVNGEKVEISSIIKDENGRLGVGEDEAQRIWKDYFEDLYNIYTQEQVAVNMCWFDGIQKKAD